VPAPEKLIIDTPEQIALEFPLAGVGSRFLALAFDTVLQAGAIAVLAVCALAARWLAGLTVSTSGLGTWAIAALLAGAFLIYSGYFAIFESIWAGQTPGKRLVGLRVIEESGRPLTVYGAIIRNLVRIVDQAPAVYAVAILSVLLTRRQQRLGDLAAGTVVVHERIVAPPLTAAPAPHAAVRGAHRLTPAEVIVIEEFLRRREALDSWVRRQSAERIARRMAARLEITAIDDDEALLEQLAAEYRAVERYR
jgi:uncharacterized RDD family membrane protein YckC